MSDGLTEFEKQLIYTAFYRHVNMSPKEIELRVGVEPEKPAAIDGQNVEAAVVADESLAIPFEASEEQKIGRQLVSIKRRKKEELTEADFVLMRKCVNYIRKHAEKPPKDEEKLGDWAEHLMTWGYDPKKSKPKEPESHFAAAAAPAIESELPADPPIAQ